MQLSKTKKNILLIEDEREQADLIEHVFEQDAQWAALSVAYTLAEAKSRIDIAIPDLVISDLRLPDGSGVALLQPHGEEYAHPGTNVPVAARKSFPVVIMSGYGDQKAAVDAMKAGALDYIVKDSKVLLDLPRVAERALREWQLIMQREQAEEALRLNLAKTELLYDTARALSAIETLSKKLQVVVDNTAEALPASLVTLSTIHLANRMVTQTVVGGWALEDFTPPTFEELWDGLAGWSLRSLEPVLLSSGLKDEREGSAAWQRRVRMNVGSLVIAPLTYRGRTLGVLSALNRLGERDFTERHKDLVVALANQAAGAVENARLFDETNRLLTQMRKRAAQIQQIIDVVPDGVLLLDERRRIVQENSAAHEFLELLPGRRVGQILTHVGGIAVVDLLVLPEGEVQNRLILTTDRQSIFEVTARPLRATTSQIFANDEGATSEWVLTVRDITNILDTVNEQQPTQPESVGRLARMARSFWH